MQHTFNSVVAGLPTDFTAALDVFTLKNLFSTLSAALLLEEGDATTKRTSVTTTPHGNYVVCMREFPSPAPRQQQQKKKETDEDTYAFITLSSNGTTLQIVMWRPDVYGEAPLFGGDVSPQKNLITHYFSPSQPKN